MDKKQLVQSIIDIINRNDILQGNYLIDESTSLYDECGIDSYGVVDLVVCIEECYNFEFLDTDLEMSNFENVSKIADLVLERF